MSEDDPLGQRNFESRQDPMQKIGSMLDELKKTPVFSNKLLRITLDVSMDEGIQILGLLKDLRK